MVVLMASPPPFALPAQAPAIVGCGALATIPCVLPAPRPAVLARGVLAVTLGVLLLGADLVGQDAEELRERLRASTGAELLDVVSLDLPAGLPGALVVHVPWQGGLTLELVAHTLRADDAQLLVWDGRGYQPRPLPPAATYRGALAGDPGSG